MCQLVRLQAIAGRIQFSARVVKHVVGLGRRADVFHAAAKIAHCGLRIFCIGILHAGLFGKELHHLRQTRRRHFSFLDFISVNVSNDRNAGVLAGHRRVLANDY